MGKPTGDGGTKKISFKDKHALETLPAQVAKLDANIKRLQAKLADSAFYARDPAGFRRTSEALATAETERAQAEERWLELEILRETVEGR